MLALGIDACLGHCSVALVRGGDVLVSRSEAMARGHVERLAPMVSEALRDAGVVADSLGLTGVTCGPGGFTGARLGVAFARGLALAVGCRSVGVTTLEALAAPHEQEDLIVALDGRRGDLFVQYFSDGMAVQDARAIRIDDLPSFVEKHGSPPVIGPEALPAIDPADVARLAMQRMDAEPPRPLYLRAPRRQGCRKAGPAVIEHLAEPPSPSVARELATLQKRAYAAIGIRPWTAQEIEASAASPYVFLTIARDDDCRAQGFACFSVVEGEGEVLALAVDPKCRRRGVASRLFDAMTTGHEGARITRLVLEVAETNLDAVAFYEMLGFVDIARRRDYYRIGGNAVDAKIMERVRD